MLLWDNIISVTFEQEAVTLLVVAEAAMADQALVNQEYFARSMILSRANQPCMCRITLQKETDKI